MEIISAGLIFLYLHNISVAQEQEWALNINTALCIILIIKGNSHPVSPSDLAWVNDWRSPSERGSGEHVDTGNRAMMSGLRRRLSP